MKNTRTIIGAIGLALMLGVVAIPFWSAPAFAVEYEASCVGTGVPVAGRITVTGSAPASAPAGSVVTLTDLTVTIALPDSFIGNGVRARNPLTRLSPNGEFTITDEQVKAGGQWTFSGGQADVTVTGAPGDTFDVVPEHVRFTYQVFTLSLTANCTVTAADPFASIIIETPKATTTTTTTTALRTTTTTSRATTTIAVTTTRPPANSTTTVAAALGATESRPNSPGGGGPALLPATGTSTKSMMAVGAALILLGAMTVSINRRRRAAERE